VTAEEPAAPEPVSNSAGSVTAGRTRPPAKPPGWSARTCEVFSWTCRRPAVDLALPRDSRRAVKYLCDQRIRTARVTLRWRGFRPRGDRPRISTLLYVLHRWSWSPADRRAVCSLTCRNAACRPGWLLVWSHSVT